MFNWFKRKPKKVKILLVVNGDVHEPIDYSNKVDVDLKTEIHAACYDVGIEHDDKLIDDIARTLEAGETYYLHSVPVDYGFEVITVEV